MRLTLDWDNIDEYEAKFRFANLKKIFPGKKAVLRRSPGRKGWHIIIYGLNWDFNFMVEIRKIYGDDPKRIKADIWNHEHGIPTNVLFTEKDGKFAEESEM